MLSLSLSYTGKYCFSLVTSLPVDMGDTVIYNDMEGWFYLSWLEAPNPLSFLRDESDENVFCYVNEVALGTPSHLSSRVTS